LRRGDRTRRPEPHAHRRNGPAAHDILGEAGTNGDPREQRRPAQTSRCGEGVDCSDVQRALRTTLTCFITRVMKLSSPWEGEERNHCSDASESGEGSPGRHAPPTDYRRQPTTATPWANPPDFSNT